MLVSPRNFVCVGVVDRIARGQVRVCLPVPAPPGTVLTFHLQTRLNPADRNEMDSRQRGRCFPVRMLSALIQSWITTESVFHCEVVEFGSAGSKIIVHSESEVRGILVLLRSRNHPR